MEKKGHGTACYTLISFGLCTFGFAVRLVRNERFRQKGSPATPSRMQPLDFFGSGFAVSACFSCIWFAVISAARASFLTVYGIVGVRKKMARTECSDKVSSLEKSPLGTGSQTETRKDMSLFESKSI